MPSAIELAISRFRQAVLAEEMEATRTLISAYQPARERLIKRIDELVDAMQAAGSLTPTQITRFERAVALAQQVEEEVTRLSRIANQTITDTQGRMVAMAGEHAQGLALAAVPDASAARIDATWNRINPDAVEALAGRMSDGSPLGRTLSQFGGEARDALVAALQGAVTTGQNPRATARQLATVIDAEQWKLLRIARTETLNSYRSASLQNYRDNSDIVSGWRWVSAHQPRTCLACLSLDGQVFELSVEQQPCHPNCRCSAVPEVIGEPPIDRQTGAEWFEAQPRSTQLEMIPKGAHDDFLAGRLKIQDFVQLDSSPDWGDSYRQASVTTARANAARRGASTVENVILGLPRTRSIAVFRPSSTIEEAHLFANELGVKDANYGKNLHIANLTNEAIVGHINRGFRAPATIRTKTIAGEGNLSPRNPAAYFPENDALVLNPSSAYWRNPDKFAGEQFKARFWSSDTTLQVVTHELGHVAHVDILGVQEFRLASKRFLFPELAGTREGGAMVRQVTGDVSRYALSNEVEFVAEVYAGKVAGKVYSDDIEQLYVRYKGPPVDVIDDSQRMTS